MTTSLASMVQAAIQIETLKGQWAMKTAECLIEGLAQMPPGIDNDRSQGALLAEWQRRNRAMNAELAKIQTIFASVFLREKKKRDASEALLTLKQSGSPRPPRRRRLYTLRNRTVLY